MRSPARVVAAFCLAAAAASDASAATRRGTILTIDDGRAIVDLGAKDGLRERAEVRINKRYVLVHPVTKAKIEDELPLGSGRIEKVSERIASVTLGNISKAVVGDVVVVEVDDGAVANGEPAPPAGAYAEGAARVACQPCQRDPEAKKVHEAWSAALQLGAADRKSAWLRFLQANPRSPYRAQVVRELAFLASLVDVAPKPSEWDARGTYADSSLEKIFDGEAL